MHRRASFLCEVDGHVVCVEELEGPPVEYGEVAPIRRARNRLVQHEGVIGRAGRARAGGVTAERVALVMWPGTVVYRF